MSSSNTYQSEPEDISDEMIAASNVRADGIFTELVDQFGEMDDEGLDPIAVIYSLWIRSIYLLVGAGWTPEDLARDLARHANNAVRHG